MGIEEKAEGRGQEAEGMCNKENMVLPNAAMKWVVNPFHSCIRQRGKH